MTLTKPATLKVELAKKAETPTTDAGTTGGSTTPAAPAQNQTAPDSTATQPSVGQEVSAGTGKSAGSYKVTAAAGAAEGKVAFEKASGKTSVVPDTVEIGGKVFAVTEIAANAFKGSSAKSITVGNNVVIIGAKSFNGATKVKSITLGKSVKASPPKRSSPTRS